MIEAFVSEGNALPLFIEQFNATCAFACASDAPERQIKAGGEFGDFCPFIRGCREDQFIVVAAAQLGLTRHAWGDAGRQAGKLRGKDFGINAGAFGDMAEVGQQTVGDIDGCMSQRAILQGLSQLKAWQRSLQGGNAARL